MIYLHQIVGNHLIPNAKKCTDINHKDGNKLNNSIENLEWCTRSENIRHAYAKGLRRPTKPKTRKLKNIDVINIIHLYREGCGYSRIGKMYNRDPKTIWSIIKGETYKDVAADRNRRAWNGNDNY